MAKQPTVVVLLLTVTSLAGLWVPATAQAQAQPGYLDPEPVLRAAEAAIGADRLRCVTIAGRATSGMVGQQRLHGFEVDWPRGAPLTNYRRHDDSGVKPEALVNQPPLHTHPALGRRIDWDDHGVRGPVDCGTQS